LTVNELNGNGVGMWCSWTHLR